MCDDYLQIPPYRLAVWEFYSLRFILETKQIA